MALRLCYLDTDPLVCWAEGLAANPLPRNVHIGAALEALVAAPEVTVAASEVTLIELHNTMCRKWRDGHADMRQYNSRWFAAVQERLMGWIAGKELLIVDFAPKAFETAIQYITWATRDHGRAFGAWDAVHLCQAAGWARAEGKRVELVTSDSHFGGFIDVFPEFSRFVDLFDLAAAQP